MQRVPSDSMAAEMFLDHFGVSPRAAPDLEGLESILAEFSRIPWENLTKFLVKAEGLRGQSRLRSPETVIRKHIEDGTGGTCFSLTEALAAVLRRAGYRCGPVMADMSHGKNIHCGLIVAVPDTGTFLADPGYLVPFPVPLRSGVGARLSLPGQELEWRPCGEGVFDLYTAEEGRSIWRYRLRTGPVGRSEFLGHWQESFDATGMNSLHANLRVDSGRIYAHNMNLRRTEGGGKFNEKLREDYAARMETFFGISSRIAKAAQEEWRRSCLNR
ncbi:MAG: hypothetical protein AVO35_03625 [Candidatus Aegiribacteria sp. MLS_C]|nr:MAG: hypothetical protein AVO35_03625 [Candidatus Aegiribacteria sp. MLS_C]